MLHALKNVDLQVSSSFCTLAYQILPENRIGYITVMVFDMNRVPTCWPDA